jgi:hypothetical protein
MSVQATVNGSRLAYVVVPIEGKVMRPIHRYTKDKGIIVKDEPQDGGFLVYFPRGHVLRIRDQAQLKLYKLDKKPRVINLQGLNDPNSPIGQLMAAQDDQARQGAMVNMERQVIQLATAKTGKVQMPEQVQEQEDDIEDGKLIVRPTRRLRKDARAAA